MSALLAAAISHPSWQDRDVVTIMLVPQYTGLWPFDGSLSQACYIFERYMVTPILRPRPWGCCKQLGPHHTPQPPPPRCGRVERYSKLTGSSFRDISPTSRSSKLTFVHVCSAMPTCPSQQIRRCTPLSMGPGILRTHIGVLPLGKTDLRIQAHLGSHNLAAFEL